MNEKCLWTYRRFLATAYSERSPLMNRLVYYLIRQINYANDPSAFATGFLYPFEHVDRKYLATRVKTRC